VLGEAPMQDAIDALIAETNRARQFGFLQTELDRAKASLMNIAEKSFKEKDKSVGASFSVCN
jgi:zinc protease